MKNHMESNDYWESLFQTEPPQLIKRKEEQKPNKQKSDVHISPVQPED